LHTCCLFFHFVVAANIIIIVDTNFLAKVLPKVEDTVSFDKLFAAVPISSSKLALHDVIGLVSLKAQFLAKFLVRNAAFKVLTARIKLVTLPA